MPKLSGARADREGPAEATAASDATAEAAATRQSLTISSPLRQMDHEGVEGAGQPRYQDATFRSRPMPMPIDALEAALREGFPDAEIKIDDLAGDGDHYKARIVSAAFAGLPRVRQHQLVYAALKGRMGGELHALALETAAPT